MRKTIIYTIFPDKQEVFPKKYRFRRFPELRRGAGDGFPHQGGPLRLNCIAGDCLRFSFVSGRFGCRLMTGPIAQWMTGTNDRTNDQRVRDYERIKKLFTRIRARYSKKYLVFTVP